MVRVVTIRMATSELVRPMAKIMLLPKATSVINALTN